MKEIDEYLLIFRGQPSQWQPHTDLMRMNASKSIELTLFTLRWNAFQFELLLYITVRIQWNKQFNQLHSNNVHRKMPAQRHM